MSKSKTQNSILEHGYQVVIYGAKGWMGRSAIDYMSGTAPHEDLMDRVLLIGSKQSQILINKHRFDIEDPASGFSKIEKGAIFFNAAFLRREFLTRMDNLEYTKRNHEISTYAKSVIVEKQIGSFVNLSSGAARDLSIDNNPVFTDLYSKLKSLLEQEYSELCSKTGAAFVNCRIYSLAGKYLNEYANLALSSFIAQALSKRSINIDSPFSRRTYVDSVDLAQVLLRRAFFFKSETFDSGGSLVTMLDLARAITEILGRSDIKIHLGDDKPEDYFGDFQTFNSLAAHMYVSLSDLNDQIHNTLKAFDSRALS